MTPQPAINSARPPGFCAERDAVKAGAWSRSCDSNAAPAAEAVTAAAAVWLACATPRRWTCAAAVAWLLSTMPPRWACATAATAAACACRAAIAAAAPLAPRRILSVCFRAPCHPSGYRRLPLTSCRRRRRCRSGRRHRCNHVLHAAAIAPHRMHAHGRHQLPGSHGIQRAHACSARAVARPPVPRRRACCCMHFGAVPPSQLRALLCTVSCARTTGRELPYTPRCASLRLRSLRPSGARPARPHQRLARMRRPFPRARSRPPWPSACGAWHRAAAGAHRRVAARAAAPCASVWRVWGSGATGLGEGGCGNRGSSQSARCVRFSLSLSVRWWALGSSQSHRALKLTVNRLIMSLFCGVVTESSVGSGHNVRILPPYFRAPAVCSRAHAAAPCSEKTTPPARRRSPCGRRPPSGRSDPAHDPVLLSVGASFRAVTVREARSRRWPRRLARRLTEAPDLPRGGGGGGCVSYPPSPLEDRRGWYSLPASRHPALLPTLARPAPSHVLLTPSTPSLYVPPFPSPALPAPPSLSHCLCAPPIPSQHLGTLTHAQVLVQQPPNHRTN
eukprot:365753-Chlamydomonas_euryale.AAC.7